MEFNWKENAGHGCPICSGKKMLAFVKSKADEDGEEIRYELLDQVGEAVMKLAFTDHSKGPGVAVRYIKQQDLTDHEKAYLATSLAINSALSQMGASATMIHAIGARGEDITPEPTLDDLPEDVRRIVEGGGE